MLPNYRKILLSKLGILLFFIANAQEPALRSSINLNILGWSYEKHQQNGGAVLAFEWKPLHFVGLELGGGYGWFRDYNLIQYSVSPGVFHDVSLDEMNGDYWLFQGKLSGYLPLWRDDNNVIKIQLFADVYGGMSSSVQMKGELKIYESELTKTASGNSEAHFFHGFEFGIWGALSEKASMKLFVGTRNINFKDPIEKMNTHLDGFPLSFGSYVPAAYIGTSLCFTIPKKKMNN
ncbi:MAG TPA: hypothetical protein PK335_06585 [Draconibacterium sp.]|nr:hypothetical protein [Draconibacterium sp.]